MAESPVNGVGTTLASACLSTDTTLSLTSATGFTNAQYHCLISDGTNYEIVLATALSGTTLTVTRAVEAYNGVTTAFAFASGSTINVVPTVASVVGLIEGQPYLTATGVGNATSATRYVGGTANGAPTSGTFSVGDFIIDQTGTIWVCTTAGTPGTWTTTISSHLSLRSASATVGRNEITLFSGSTASQTLTAPSNPIDGSNWTVINKASVAVTLSFTPSMIALGSSSGVTTFSVPVNGSYSFVNYNGSQWYMVASNSATQLIGTLPTANGGTGQSAVALGSLLVGNSGNSWQTLPIGSNGQMLTVSGGGTLPAWQNVASNAVTSINGGTTGLTPSTATQGAVTLGGTLNVANGGTGVTTSTGTGNVVLNTSPTLVTPALGTPSSVVLTSGTGLPLTTGVTGTLPVANGGTGVTTSTGSGNNVLSTSPVITGPYESVGISATALSGSVAASIAISTNAVYYYTANPTAAWALNITNAPTTTGQCATVAILVNNGATAYLPSNITVNTVQAGASSSVLPVQGATNNSITSYYQSGVSWAADASTLDVYTISVICTGSSAWTLLLGLTKF